MESPVVEMPGNAESISRNWVEIDLGALERNVGRIRAALPAHVAYIAVVKADAYGHGMAPLAAHLMQSGADAFAVATIEEALELRELGAGWPILILSPVHPNDDTALLEQDLAATLSSLDEAERWARLAQDRQRPLRVHLKIDTGMGRVGVWHEDHDTLARLGDYPGLRVEGAYTHFATADTDPAFARLQRQCFLDAWRVTGLSAQGRVIHADNSAGLDTFDPGGPFNAVRIGLRQFGLGMPPGSVLDHVSLERVLSWFTRVALVKELPAGTGISYGHTTRLKRPSRVGVLPVGYGDGLPLAASNQAKVLVRGRRCPLLGRITMDQAMVDLTDLPDVRAGEPVTLIGEQAGETLPVRAWADWAGTIPWAIYCGISKRVPRRYRANRR